MVGSVWFGARRRAVEKSRRGQKVEDQEVVRHLGRRVAEEGIGPVEADRIVAAVVGKLEEADIPAAVGDYKHLVAADTPVEDTGPGAEVGHSRVVEGMASGLEVDMAFVELLGKLVDRSLLQFNIK